MPNTVTKKPEAPQLNEGRVLMPGTASEHIQDMPNPNTVRSTINVPSTVMVRALVQPKTYNADENTVEVTVSEGASVRRYDWWEGAYFWEELSLDPEHVRMERLESGQCPVLKDHSAYSINNQIGVVMSARIEKGALIAVIRLSDNPDHAGIVGDIQKGIIRNISVGYSIHELTERTAGKDGIPVLRVTDWEPFEVSFVTVPADAGAGVRSKENLPTNPCTIIRVQPETKENTMTPEQIEAARLAEVARVAAEAAARAAAPAPQTVDAEAIRAEATKAERHRQTEIRRIATGLGLSDDAEDLIVRGIELGVAQTTLMEKAIARSAESKAEGSTQVRVTPQGGSTLIAARNAIENAVLYRGNSTRQNKAQKFELSKDGADFQGMRLGELAREYLRIAGIEVKGMSPSEIAHRVMTTTDFPILMANVANKTMRSGYEYAPNTFEALVSRTKLPDFKRALRGQLGEAPRLRKQNENGETRHGVLPEAGEYIKLDTYSAAVPLTRQTIINDDMDALSRLPESMGIQARLLESDLVWSIFINNVVMNDGNAMFSAAHANLLTGAGSALDPANFASMDNARSAIRKKRGLDGVSRIRNVPDLLIVPTELESRAERMIGATMPNTNGNVNPYGPGGRVPMGLIVEDRLSDLPTYGTSAWYMASSTGMDKIELATLEGSDGPQILTDTDINVDGTIVKILHDIGVSPIDSKWVVRSNGA